MLDLSLGSKLLAKDEPAPTRSLAPRPSTVAAVASRFDRGNGFAPELPAPDAMSDLERLAATPGAAEAYAAFDAQQQDEGGLAALQRLAYSQPPEPPLDVMQQVAYGAPEELAQELMADQRARDAARDYPSMSAGDPAYGGMPQFGEELFPGSRRQALANPEPVTGMGYLNPLSALRGFDASFVGPTQRFTRGVIPGHSRAEDILAALAGEATRPSSLAAMALPPIGAARIANPLARIAANAGIQGGANVGLDVATGRADRDYWTDPMGLALSAGLGAGLGGLLPESGAGLRALRDVAESPRATALRTSLASESGQFDPSWLARKIDEAQKSVDEYEPILAQRGVLDAETRKALKAERDVVKQRIAALNDIEARGAPVVPGEHEATALSAIDDEVARIEAELTRRSIPFGGRAGISAAQQKRMIRAGKDAQFTNTFKTLSTSDLNARRTALQQLKGELPEGLGAPDVLAPETAAPPPTQFHGDVLHAGKVVPGTWTQDAATPNVGAFAPDDPSAVARGRYALSDVRNRQSIMGDQGAGGTQPQMDVPPQTPGGNVPIAERQPLTLQSPTAKGGTLFETSTGPGELVPAARPAPPEPSTAAPESSLQGGGVGEAPQRLPDEAVAPEAAIPAEPPVRAAEGAGAPPEVPPTALAAEPPDNFDGDVLALTETIRKSKKLRPEQERAFAAERKQRAGKVGGILEGGTGDSAFIKARGSLKGEFEGHATFEPPNIPEPRRVRMVEEIRTTGKIRSFEKLNAKQAFDKVMAGVLPEPAELEKLERVFGTDFAQAVLDKVPATWTQLVVDVLMLPKSMLASFDLSFPLRQGMILAPSQPKAWLRSWGPMVKAFATESNAKLVDDAMQADPQWGRFLDAGGYHTPLKGGTRAQREESFASRLVEKIPGMRSSQRAFQTFGNKLRFEAWKNLVDGADAVGDDAVDTAFAKFVNHATGRGDVPFRAGEILPGLSAFFSLRNFVSRFQVLADPLTAKDVPLQVRAKIAGDLGKFFAAGVTTMGLMKLAHDNGVPGFESLSIEANPKSTDFGKVRFGDRRYDFWTGYSQMARYAAQIMSGERKAELPDGSKAMVPIDQKKYALRFLESKLDPSLSLLIDLYEGETYTGEKLKGDLPTLRREAYNRMVPLFIQDLNESLQKYGPEGAAFAVPGLVGASITDYETSEGAKQYAAKQVMPGRWEQIGLPTRDAGFRSEYWKSRLPATTVDPRKFDSFGDYRTAYIEHWTAKRPENISEEMARDLSARKFDSLEAVKDFAKQQQAAELKFWRDHPDLLQQALDANIEDVSKEKLKILEGAGVP